MSRENLDSLVASSMEKMKARCSPLSPQNTFVSEEEQEKAIAMFKEGMKLMMESKIFKHSTSISMSTQSLVFCDSPDLFPIIEDRLGTPSCSEAHNQMNRLALF